MSQFAPRYYFLIVAIVVILSSIHLYQGGTSSIAERISISSNRPSKPSKPTLRDAVATLFRPIKIKPTKVGYHDAKGSYYTGGQGSELSWTKPLGKKILIVDIDTRVPTGDNQILNPDKKINWQELENSGAGLTSHAISNHYLYAMIHGYDYKFFQALPIPDHYATWILPHILKELLPDYQVVVALDADVVVSHLEVPLEWMFNRWDIKEHTSFALPHDTEEFDDGNSISRDSFDVPVLNTGLVLAQNNNRTFDMLDAWSECTTEKRYPGCAQWKNKWSHEQRAFSEYIRWDPEFNNTDNIVGIPCDDAVGYPGFKEQNEGQDRRTLSDCNGNFFRHYTLGKNKVKNGGMEVTMQALAEVLQKNLLGNQDTLWQKEVDPDTPEHEESDVEEEWEVAEEEEEEEEDGSKLNGLRNSDQPEAEAPPVILEDWIPVTPAK